MNAVIAKAASGGAADRAAKLLTNATTSGEAGACLSDLQAEMADLSARTEKVRSASLQPAISMADAVKRRGDADALAFELERMRTAEAALIDRIAKLKASEAAEAAVSEYEAAKDERDHLAAWFRDRYGPIVAELVEMATAAKASNARLEAVNRNRPSGKPWLASAETVGRERQPNSPHPTVVSSMRLPAPRDCPSLAWPTPDAPFSTDIDAQLAKIRAAAGGPPK